MKKSIPAILAAAAVAAFLSGCASKPKPAMSSPLAAAEPAPPTELPPGPAAHPRGIAQTGQQALVAAAGEDRVYFALDSDALDPEGRDTLRRQAAWLRANPAVPARIEGHADERGTREYNLALGARRASAARQALIGEGVASDRLSTLSFGKERPLDPASTEEAWARNRNAQTVVVGVAER